MATWRLIVPALVALADSILGAGESRPLIGIYSAPFSESSLDYVAASYVKWLEAAGARSLPIPYNLSKQEAEDIFQKINGVLYPGGGAGLPDGAKHMFDLALAANDNGTHFPIWGTCLGFEWLIQMVAGDPHILETGFDSENISLPLNLTTSAPSSRMYGAISSLQGHRDRAESEASQLRRYLSDASNPPTMNNHEDGISAEVLAANAKLSGFFSVLSANVDRKGRRFVSTIEGLRYPVYGVQWHPV